MALILHRVMRMRLRAAKTGVTPERALRPQRQPQTRPAPDAQHGPAGHGARPQHQQGTPPA